MEQRHDGVADAGTERGTGIAMPVWFTFAARALVLGLLSQFLSAGTALFRDAGIWPIHGAVGGALSLPVLALAWGAFFLRPLRGFGRRAGLVLALYLTQVALAAGASPLLLSLHPFNASLLLTASLVMLAGVERRRHPGASGPPASASRRALTGQGPARPAR